MAIIDIKFMNNEGYLLKDIPLSLCECEKQMRLIKYDEFYDHYRSFRDDNGVENTQFPSIIFSFYNIIFCQNKMPSPQDLLKEYYELYDDQITINGSKVYYNGNEYSKECLDARILRTYPSLVRDYHFYLMLVESKTFDKVIYSCKTDISGKDILIIHNDKQYEVSLFVETKRGNFFKNIKNAYRHKYANEIQLPLNLKTAEKCGDFFVYSVCHIEKIKKSILK